MVNIYQIIDVIIAKKVLILNQEQLHVLVVQLELILIKVLPHALNARQANIPKNHLPNVKLVQLDIIRIKVQAHVLNVKKVIIQLEDPLNA